MKVRYFQDADDNFIAVTDETPKGPLKGFVFAGRRLVGDTVSEEAFGIDQLPKWKKLGVGDVPPRCLEALGYDKPTPPVVACPAPSPAPPVVPPNIEMGGVKFEGVKITPVKYGPPPARYSWFALGLVLYLAAVAFFWWIKQ